MTNKTEFFRLVGDIRSHEVYEDYFNNQKSFEDQENDEVVNWFSTIKMILQFRYESDEQYRLAYHNAKFILRMLNDYANKK